MITDSDVKKFQRLYEQEFGKKISLEESLECTESLVEMIKLIYKPIRKNVREPFTKKDNGLKSI